MFVYKIRNKSTGLFCNGGLEFKRSGKIWFSKTEIKDHLRYIKTIFMTDEVTNYFSQVEIVVFKVQPISVLQITELECQTEIDQKIE